jgi:hypothetical protein
MSPLDSDVVFRRFPAAGWSVWRGQPPKNIGIAYFVYADVSQPVASEVGVIVVTIIF